MSYDFQFIKQDESVACLARLIDFGSSLINLKSKDNYMDSYVSCIVRRFIIMSVKKLKSLLVIR